MKILTFLLKVTQGFTPCTIGTQLISTLYMPYNKINKVSITFSSPFGKFAMSLTDDVPDMTFSRPICENEFWIFLLQHTVKT